MEPKFLTYIIHFVFFCSLASLILPPIETFKDFPRFQKSYALAVTIITRWASLNLRNTLYSKYFESDRNGPDSNSPAK